MKRILLIAATAALLQGCSKSNTAGPDVGTVTDSAVVTTRGTALGNLVTKQIGQDGGSIVSADGVAELVFPAGALKTTTAIGIQPISNSCPNSLLNGYRFTPEGLTFGKQPTLIIHYPDSVLQGTSAGLLGIGFQDSTGAWNEMTRTTIDSANKKISVPIPHFSDWFFFAYIRIVPGATRVKVATTRELGVIMLKLPEDTNELARPIVNLNKVSFTKWSVNGIASGNDIIGNIAPETSKGRYALYGAPAKVPDPATVTISVEVPYENHKYLLVSYITVYDVHYDIKMTQDNPIGFANFYQMHDEASYSILLKKDGGDITNIKNQPPTLTEIAASPCTEQITPFDGPINVANPVGVSVSSDNIITASFPPTIKSTVTATLLCSGAPPQTKYYPLDELNGTISFPKRDTTIQIQQYRPDGAIIIFTITPVAK